MLAARVSRNHRKLSIKENLMISSFRTIFATTLASAAASRYIW